MVDCQRRVAIAKVGESCQRDHCFLVRADGGGDDATPLPLFASAFVAALRAELAAIVAAVVVPAVSEVTTVPSTAFDFSTPEAGPPAVLT